MRATSIESGPRQAAAGNRPVGLESFLAELLTEQQRLQTPVARFADSEPSALGHRPSAFHTDLIPLTAPAPGEQYAFEVDLDACSGCKACVSGCHSLNGLDEHETWREVGLVLGGDATRPFQQTITTACHHCADPACANGCPVLAYEKDPVTGIVRHLDDQCIGCQYCVMKCPYDVPQYNARLGIVRKCDMCHGRLAAGEAPACVQACPTHAIRITKVAAHSTTPPAAFLPPAVAPDPGYTQPTTRYVTKRLLPADVRAADAAGLRPQPPHWPLTWMLVLTQLSVGALGASLAVAEASRHSSVGLQLLALTAAAAGLTASVAHLGQPWRAWRVFLGWRKSWLSREALVFGAYFVLLGAALGMRPSALPLSPLAFSVGFAGVFCSAMIYADTHRTWWTVRRSAGRFFGTTAVLGLAAGACFDRRMLPWLVGAVAVKLAAEAILLRGRVRGPAASAPGGRNARDDVCSARLMMGPLQRTLRLRIFLGAFGGGLLPLAAAIDPAVAAGCANLAFVALLGGEMAERSLYFRAVVAPKMPGMPAR